MRTGFPALPGGFGFHPHPALAALCSYYALGLLLFPLAERPNELDRYKQNRALYNGMDRLFSFEYCRDEAFQDLSFCQSQEKFRHALQDYFNGSGPNSLVDKGNWGFFGTLFFLTSLATTIGYGHSHPGTAVGQMLCIGFAVCGLPIMAWNLLLIAKWWLRGVEMMGGGERKSAGVRLVYLLSLFSLFLFGGAFVFRQVEPNWHYSEALYFCFVTLSTIGFGDYTPSSNLSRVVAILYMLGGLGVCASLLASLVGMLSGGGSGGTKQEVENTSAATSAGPRRRLLFPEPRADADEETADEQEQLLSVSLPAGVTRTNSDSNFEQSPAPSPRRGAAVAVLGVEGSASPGGHGPSWVWEAANFSFPSSIQRG
eukprot:g2674.t1